MDIYNNLNTISESIEFGIYLSTGEHLDVPNYPLEYEDEEDYPW